MSVFETETMAELCVRQGLVSEALAIYRRLVAGATGEAIDDATRARRAARLAELERIARGVAQAREAAAEPQPAVAGAAPGAPTLTVERRADALRLEWSLPAETPHPALQLLLLRRGRDGIEAETRTVSVDAPRGALTLDTPGLYSVRAAAGWLDGARFVPIVRAPSH
jgi:hypothetical protein